MDVGKYVAPNPTEPPPIARIVEDGVLIAESLVVMTLRNQVIVDALRDRLDFDRESLIAAARRELDALADNEWETAERLRVRREDFVSEGAWVEEPDSEERRRESRRREAVHRAMSTAFAARAEAGDVLADLVERSRSQAWNEVATVIISRAAVPEPERDAEYELRRSERLGAFLALDLSELAVRQGVSLL